MSNQKSKKIFLILGIGREKRNWSHPAKVLQAAFPDYEVITLDNPGMGEYHKMAVPLSVEKNVDFLKTSFDKLKGEENYFIGWSLGGMIVSKWGQLYPKDMNGMVLITSSYGSLSMVWQRLRPLIIPPVLLAIISKGRRRENGMFNTTCKNEQNRERLVNEWIEIDEESPVTVINIIRQLIAATLFFTKSFKKLHPTLILGAPNDQLVNNKCSKDIVKFLDAPYQEHPTAGHDVFNDYPEWVAEQVKAWLNTAK
jgi:alpha-beta hydrolase superfamily lysophospholipase